MTAGVFNCIHQRPWLKKLIDNYKTKLRTLPVRSFLFIVIS